MKWVDEVDGIVDDAYGYGVWPNRVREGVIRRDDGDKLWLSDDGVLDRVDWDVVV